MAWLVLLLGVALIVLWTVGAATGAAVAWYLWISFAIGLALVGVALWELLQPIPRQPCP